MVVLPDSARAVLQKPGSRNWELMLLSLKESCASPARDMSSGVFADEDPFLYWRKVKYHVLRRRYIMKKSTSILTPVSTSDSLSVIRDRVQRDY